MIKLKDIIKESKWSDRNWGDPLPTLEDYIVEFKKNLKPTDGSKEVTFTNKDNYDDAVKSGDYEDPEDKGGDKKSDAGKLGGGDYERDFEDDPDDIDNLDTALDDDPTRGDPDDAWDDEEGRAKPTGKTDADDDVHQKGMAKARDLAKKGMENRPGGKQAEEDYMKADQMMMKYAGVDIEKAEYWAKKKRQASNAMMGEITINGKKYEPITESINPTIFDPNKEIKRAWNRISLRQFDRKWKKEII